MNFKEILELIDKVSESGIGAVEVEQAGTKVRIEGKPAQQQVITVAQAPSAESASSAPMQVYSAPQPTETKAEEKKRLEEESEAGLHIITSPIVGTYYRAPNPESPSFVNEGDRTMLWYSHWDTGGGLKSMEIGLDTLRRDCHAISREAGRALWKGTRR